VGLNASRAVASFNLTTSKLVLALGDDDWANVNLTADTAPLATPE